VSKERTTRSPKKFEAMLIDISKQQDKGSRTKRTVQGTLPKGGGSPSTSRDKSSRMISRSQKELATSNVKKLNSNLQYRSVGDSARAHYIFKQGGGADGKEVEIGSNKS
jgi:hypothetical protein